MLFLWVGNFELLFFLGHRSGFNLQDPALGDGLFLAVNAFVIVIGPAQFWFARRADGLAVG